MTDDQNPALHALVALYPLGILAQVKRVALIARAKTRPSPNSGVDRAARVQTILSALDEALADADSIVREAAPLTAQQKFGSGQEAFTASALPREACHELAIALETACTRIGELAVIAAEAGKLFPEPQALSPSAVYAKRVAATEWPQLSARRGVIR